MDREARITLAKQLCDKAKCNQEKRQIHFDQIVNHNWNPHPPAAFVQWWKSHPENSIGPARAYNCRRYVDEFQSTTALPL